MAWGTGTPWGAGAVWGDNPTEGIITEIQAGLVDPEGGTIITLLGTGFTQTMTVEFVDPGNNEVFGVGTIVDPRLDVTPGRAVVGTPPLFPNTYSVRIKNEYGVGSPTGFIYVVEHAPGYKAVKIRSAWAGPWLTGARWLSGGGG